MLEKIKTHSSLIIGNKSIFEILKKEIMQNSFESIIFERIAEDKDTYNFKIEDVKSLQNFMVSKKQNAYVLIDKNLRNTQIQNAMLKLLEEGKDNIKLIIVSDSTSHFLPTIISRVQVLNTEYFGLEINSNNSNKNIKSKNIFSEHKKKLIINKDFSGLEKLIKLEDLNNRGLLSEKQLNEYLGLV